MKWINRILLLLLIFNIILVVVSWVMSLYAYPKLPQVTPLWLDLFGSTFFRTEKSLLFFICPTAQTVFFLVFNFLGRSKWFRRIAGRGASEIQSGKGKTPFFALEKEFIYLALIFFNLIFIHVQRSLILVAHGVEKGVDSFYFWSLFGILLLLIPYYRIRKKIMNQKRKEIG
jgi:hypothetical protein